MSQSHDPERGRTQARGCTASSMLPASAGPTPEFFSDRVISIVYSKGQSIFEQDDPADTIYFVISGAVIVHRTGSDGNREVMELAGEGALLGLVSGATYGCCASSLTRTAVTAIRQEAIAGSTQLQQRIGKELTRRLELMQEQARVRPRTSAASLVAQFILTLPPATKDRPLERVFITQTDMASYLGLAVETVCRIVKSLKQKNALLPGTRDRIVIADMQYLEHLAGTLTTRPLSQKR